MADPTIPKQLSARFDTSTVNNSLVVIHNRTTGDIIRRRCASDGSVIVDAADFTNSLTTNNIVDFTLSGVRFGIVTITVSGTLAQQQGSVTSTADATLTTQGVDM